MYSKNINLMYKCIISLLNQIYKQNNQKYIKRFRKKVKNMQYNEVLNRLQNLINKVPTQGELVKILGVKQSTMSERARRNSKFSPEEISLLNKHYGVNLYTNITDTSQMDFSTIKNILINTYKFDENDVIIFQKVLENKTFFKLTKLFIQALNGNKERADIIISILKDSEIAKIFTE